MSEVLRPYTDFRYAELGLDLHIQASRYIGMLEQRRLQGPIGRYATDAARAVEMAQKGQDDHRRGDPYHYAVINLAGKVVGAASLYPDGHLPLRLLRLPLPPRLAIGPLGVGYPYAKHNVSAWIGGDPCEDDNISLLSQAYAELVQKAKAREASMPPWAARNRTWTLEPVASYDGVHEAIAMSGLYAAAIGRFDDRESRSRIPEAGILSADLREHGTDPSTPYGGIELRWGRISLASQAFEEAQREHLRRYGPKGG